MGRTGEHPDCPGLYQAAGTFGLQPRAARKVRANGEKYHRQFQLVFEVLDQLTAPENDEEISGNPS
jgi:hypothetical protein